MPHKVGPFSHRSLVFPGDQRLSADERGHLHGQEEDRAQREEVFEEVIRPRENTALGLQLGVWEVSERSAMEEFLRLLSFQREFLSGDVKQIVKNPPHQNTRKDSWLGVRTNGEGKRVCIREHPKSRHQKYDFTGDRLWEETWSQWRLTIALACVGQKKMVVCDLREGRRSTLLPAIWLDGVHVVRDPLKRA